MELAAGCGPGLLLWLAPARTALKAAYKPRISHPHYHHATAGSHSHLDWLVVDPSSAASSSNDGRSPGSFAQQRWMMEASGLGQSSGIMGRYPSAMSFIREKMFTFGPKSERGRMEAKMKGKAVARVVW